MLLCARFSTHTRVDSLQVRWIRHESQLNLRAIVVLSFEGGSQVVLDITAHVQLSLTFAGGRNTLKFGHNDFHGLPDHVRERVQSASMGHSNHEFAGTQLG